MDNSHVNKLDEIVSDDYNNVNDLDLLSLQRKSDRILSGEFFYENKKLKDLKQAYDLGLRFLKWDPKKHEVSLVEVSFRLPDKTETKLNLFKEIVCITW